MRVINVPPDAAIVVPCEAATYRLNNGLEFRIRRRPGARLHTMMLSHVTAWTAKVAIDTAAKRLEPSAGSTADFIVTEETLKHGKVKRGEAYFSIEPVDEEVWCIGFVRFQKYGGAVMFLKTQELRDHDLDA